MSRLISLFWIILIDVIYVLSVPTNLQKEGAEAQKKLEIDLEKDLTQYAEDVKCKFQPNGNDCLGTGAQLPRFYFDTLMEDCKTFSYGRCPIAFNNFETRTKCYDTCRDFGPAPLPKNLTPHVFCRLQPDFGNCNDYYPMFYYDINNHHCKGFSYSGCGGNPNRFYDIATCASVCSNVVDLG